MLTSEAILERLKKLTIPGTSTNLVQKGLITSTSVEGGEITLSVASCAMPSPVLNSLERDIKIGLGAIPGVSKVRINQVDCTPSELNRIKNVIAVMSGKGGVGKSTVSSLIAISLKRQGFTVGILDADITGPSIPKLFGLTGKPLGNEKGIMPVASRTGIDVMSMNLILNNDTDAVIWRGPLIAKAIGQFWTDVLWGELDYLIVDLPPGTSDAALTTMQQITLTGVVMVTTPQELAALIVRKAIDMTVKMNARLIGVVENMAYFPNPATGEPIEIFGPSKAKHLAGEFGLPLLAQIPVDPRIAVLCDAGEIEEYNSDIVSGLGIEVIRLLEEPRPVGSSR